MRARILALALAGLAATSSEAAWDKIRCQSVYALDKQIRYCTDNTLAQLAAQECAAQVTKAWSDAAQEVAVLEEGAGSGQRGDFGQSQEKYDTATERLRTLADETEKAADMIASYPSVMVDMAGMESWNESLPCFRDVYDQIQSTVTRLDRETNQGRKVLANAVRLRAGAARLARGVGTRGGAATALGVSHESRVPSSKPRKNSSSDITGVRKEP